LQGLGLGFVLWHDVNSVKKDMRFGTCGKILVKWIFNKLDGEELNGLIWLRIGTGGGRF
jgi:hypothetical protein